MELSKKDSVITVEPNKPFYVILNGTLMAAEVSHNDAWMVKQHVLRTLNAIHCPYHKEVSLYEDENGIKHEVTYITAL